MNFVATVVGAVLVLLVFADTFFTILMPRTVTGTRRISTWLIRRSWRFFSWTGKRSKRPDGWLAVFGPFVMVALIGAWALALIAGFALIMYGLAITTSAGPIGLGDSIYLSGVTFFTLGFGDVVATDPLGRMACVTEAGLGFGFLAIVVSYLPVLYTSFSRRETLVTLMDARGGSPPSGGEMLRRFGAASDWEGLARWLERWETWAAELLETHLSYPIIAFYRSQHSDTSWVTSMTAVMDACAMIKAGIWECSGSQASLLTRQAGMTYAMCRHACVDLAFVYGIPPDRSAPRRITDDHFEQLVESLRTAYDHFGDLPKARQSLDHFSAQYEFYTRALAERFAVPYPSLIAEPGAVDNWQTSAWDPHI